MGARIRVILSAEEDRTLHELRTASTVSQRVKDRAAVIRLSHQGMYVEHIARFFGWRSQTVRDTLHRWQDGGSGGLWDAPHPGAERRWQSEDIEYLENCIRDEQRTYNSHQLAEKLKSERHVTLSADHLRQILQKRG
jgi:transposase